MKKITALLMTLILVLGVYAYASESAAQLSIESGNDFIQVEKIKNNYQMKISQKLFENGEVKLSINEYNTTKYESDKKSGKPVKTGKENIVINKIISKDITNINLDPNKKYIFEIKAYNEDGIYTSYYGMIDTNIISGSLVETEILYISESQKTVVNDNMVMTTRSAGGESEPNDSFSQADIIQDSTFALADIVQNDSDNYAYIGSVSDNDYYKVKFKYSGDVNFWLGDVPSNCNYDLVLYDENQNQLAYSTNSTGMSELISNYSVDANKNYYIVVVGWVNYDTNNAYHLRTAIYTEYDDMGWGYMYSDTDNRHISSGYGLPTRPSHYGFDIVSSNSSDHIYGDPIKNVYSGVVKLAIYNPNGSAGNYVVVETNSVDPSTGNKLRARYLHMKDAPSVVQGSTVSKGTVVGYTGNTGDVIPKPDLTDPTDLRGTHLHFDVNNAGKNSALSVSETINPELFFPTITFSGDTSL